MQLRAVPKPISRKPACESERRRRRPIVPQMLARMDKGCLERFADVLAEG
jgi:hypothetical protein